MGRLVSKILREVIRVILENVVLFSWDISGHAYVRGHARALTFPDVVVVAYLRACAFAAISSHILVVAC